MSSRRLASIAAAAVLVALAQPASEAQARKVCGTMSAAFSTGPTYRVTVWVQRGKVTCRTAKLIVRQAFFRSRTFRGWRCYESNARSYAITCAPVGQDPDRASRNIRARVRPQR